jgi:hypothetical protein
VLTIAKTGVLATGATGIAGDTVTFGFIISNSGNVTLSGIVLTDTLPGLSTPAITWPGGATGVLPLFLGPVLGLFGFGSTALGLIVGDSLHQETSTNHPMPQNRAGGYAAATFLAAYGLSFGFMIAVGALPIWCIVFAALGVIASIVLFAFLGASQTNRRKAWARKALQDHSHVGNRFEREPETAARFGIYSAVIWLATFAVIAVLVFTVGWWWAPLAFVGGFAVMMLVLARMLFTPAKYEKAAD